MALTEEHKAAIARGQAERHRRQREALADAPAIEQKKCTKCGEMKRVPEDYHMRTRKLTDGTEVKRPPGECKTCSRARADRWRDEFIAEFGEEAYKEKLKEWNGKRDKEQKRKYDRDYQRLDRALRGVKPRPPRAYRRAEDVEQTRVPSGPFMDWWKTLQPITKAKVYAAWPDAASVISRINNGQTNVTLSTAERLATLAGYPSMMATLYPDV